MATKTKIEEPSKMRVTYKDGSRQDFDATGWTVHGEHVTLEKDGKVVALVSNGDWRSICPAKEETNGPLG